MSLSRVRHVGVFSTARSAAGLAMVLGLIAGAFLALAMLSSMAAAHDMDWAASLGGRMGVAILGVAVVALTPLLGTLFGFLAGLVGAALYNLTAGLTGGVEVDLS
jgi:ABC-type amino acid transport system permease subunit